ncbi:hypothetical protein [Azohydromonas caseinilytica]|uniref:Phage protein D n=1 Tax=Azohydromonas caseinilytica TaxID=2728836 RepID=A0A848F6F6_9BURK|nr:hypothetical protein [Azohydromonas caseinilytica]NML13681.1 hypothetical protein [Azohydromonas caseinilytica]
MSTRYSARFGSYRVSDRAQDSDRLLLALLVEQSMDGLGGRCVAELSGAEHALPQLGDAVEVKLDAGGGAVTVFTGEVTLSAATATTQRIEAQDQVARLARVEVEAAYEDVSLDFIVKDLLQQAGARAGSVCRGPDVPFYAVHRQPRVLGQVWRLAQACGADLFADGEGRVHLATPDEAGSEHALRFGETIRRLDLHERVLPYDSVEVWGEGAASAKGADKAHWLSTDLSGVSAKAKVDAAGQVSTGSLGQRPLRVRDGALRAGAAAEASAKARMAWLAARRIAGSIEANGAPAVKVGDTLRIEKLPAAHAASALLKQAGALRVRGVRHTLDRESGLVTRIEI